MRPFAKWNPERDLWESDSQDLFSEHLDVFSETFPTSGTMRNGVAYELPTWEPHTADSESLSLLPSVTVSDANGPGLHGTGGMDLRTTIAMLPTPRATRGGSGTETMYRFGAERSDTGRPQGEVLLPTPVSQPSGNTPENHLRKKPGRQVVTDLSIIVENGLLETGGKLLPSPRASEGEKGGPNMRGSKGDLMLSSAVTNLPGSFESDERKPSADSKRPATGASTAPRYAGGKKLWEDVPLPLPNPRDATEATA